MRFWRVMINSLCIVYIVICMYAADITQEQAVTEGGDMFPQVPVCITIQHHISLQLVKYVPVSLLKPSLAEAALCLLHCVALKKN